MSPGRGLEGEVGERGEEGVSVGEVAVVEGDREGGEERGVGAAEPPGGENGAMVDDMAAVVLVSERWGVTG